ncbi:MULTISPECIES: hypothetical protein [unclassified Pseudocitrobacter]|uniref:hypothetical protein n=1 Tax=unclassified Pseudocitrobacter TaxID=2638778 RepID=UPI0023E372D0|nr:MULTISPECIES: hypothetical protein [unclassified Pseudocitrobacter]MDF3826920.1 hypothetical protein [Pseudocitrobacter sp. 2023EL-00150]MEC5375692.1 hypothetical protein [Pseudocitrobacter sp. MW920760]
MIHELLLWGVSLVLALLSLAARNTSHSLVAMACVLAACATGYFFATWSFLNMLRGG